MNLSLLIHFVRQDLVDRHASSALGATWTFFLPLANILIFTLVFSRIMGARLESQGFEHLGQYSYSVFLIAGLLAWNAFASSLTRITQVFQEKAGLITKVNIPLLSLPLYVIISETIIYLISMAFFTVFLFAIDFNWRGTWLWVPVIFVIQQMLAYGLGLLCAIMSVFFRDIRELLSVVTQLWFWLTPIVYVSTILPEQWHAVFRWNPMYHVIEAFRDVLIAGTNPAPFTLAAVALLGFSLLAGALYLGRLLEKDIRDFI